MKRLVLFTTGAGLLLAACDTDSRVPTQPVTRSPATQASRSQQGVPHGHVFRARRPAEASGRDNNPIQYHGGPIIYAQKVAAIYWSSRTIYNGGPAPGTTGPGTGDGSLLGFFLNHLGGSAYYNMNTTYNDGTGVYVQNNVTYTQYWASNTNVPTPGSNVSLSAIEGKIEAGFASGALTLDPNTLYLVFTDSLVNQDNLFPSACAEHGHFSWNGNDVKFGAMPRDVDQYGCKQGDYLSGAGSPNNDQVADVEVNSIAHETEETNTDPQITAWYDIYNGSLFENADKCAWMWGPTYTTGNGAKANTNMGGKDFLVQENWVNALSVYCASSLPAVTLNGPYVVSAHSLCAWSAHAHFGIAPYTYLWSAYGNGDANPISNSNPLIYTDGSNNFTLAVEVTDAQGTHMSTYTYITTTGSSGCGA